MGRIRLLMTEDHGSEDRRENLHRGSIPITTLVYACQELRITMAIGTIVEMLSGPCRLGQADPLVLHGRNNSSSTGILKMRAKTQTVDYLFSHSLAILQDQTLGKEVMEVIRTRILRDSPLREGSLCTIRTRNTIRTSLIHSTNRYLSTIPMYAFSRLKFLHLLILD